MDNQVDLLTGTSLSIADRKALIPVWIKVFSWIFLVLGFIAPIGLIFGLLGYSFQMALYGFETNNPLSIPGLIISLLFLFKGIVAYGILFIKVWAVKFAIMDAIVGIALCTFTMIYTMYYQNLSFRLELVALIPYLLKMQKIKADWESEI